MVSSFWLQVRYLSKTVVITVAGILTFYHHLEYDCGIVMICNETQIVGYISYAGKAHGTLFNRNEKIIPSWGKIAYLKVSAILNVLLVVILPIVAICILNMLLIRELHKNSQEIFELDARESLARNQNVSCFHSGNRELNF